MAKFILLANEKGGTGKTTLADEIAWGLERRGHKTGFISLDPQGGERHEKNLLEDDDAVNVVDTPGFLTQNFAKWAENADLAIIPADPSVRGLKSLKRTIKLLTDANPELLFGVVVNNFSAQRIVDRQFLELLKADEVPVLGTVPTSTSFEQGAALDKSVVELNKNSKAAAAIEQLLDQIEEGLS